MDAVTRPSITAEMMDLLTQFPTARLDVRGPWPVVIIGMQAQEVKSVQELRDFLFNLNGGKA